MKSWNRNRCRQYDLFSAITIGTALLVIFFIGSAISAVIISGIPLQKPYVQRKSYLHSA